MWATAERGTRTPRERVTKSSMASRASITLVSVFSIRSAYPPRPSASGSVYPYRMGNPTARYSRTLSGQASDIDLRCSARVPTPMSAVARTSMTWARSSAPCHVMFAGLGPGGRRAVSASRPTMSNRQSGRRAASSTSLSTPCHGWSAVPTKASRGAGPSTAGRLG